MTQAEMNKIIAILSAAYPTFTPNEATYEIWCRKFADADFQGVQRAVDAYIDRPTAFAPSIGQLKQLVITQHTDTDPVLLWHRLKRLLSYFGAEREAEALAAGVPEHVKQAIQCIGWKRLCRLPEEQAETQFVTVMRATLNRPDALTALSNPSQTQIGGATWDNR